MHNEDGWYPYYRGEKIHDNGVSYLFKDNLNGIVGVSHFHSNLLKNILIRDCSTFCGLNENYIRIAIKNRKENQILVKALGDIKWSNH